jgi:hypothetical protein
MFYEYRRRLLLAPAVVLIAAILFRGRARSVLDKMEAVIEAEPLHGTYRLHVEALLRTVRLQQAFDMKVRRPFIWACATVTSSALQLLFAVLLSIRSVPADHSQSGASIQTYQRRKVELNKELFDRIRPLKDDGKRRDVVAKDEAAKVCRDGSAASC